MADLALSNRLIAAIAILNRQEEASRAELTASTQRLQAADEAREAAEVAFRQAAAAHVQVQADHKEVEAKYAPMIADAHTERQVLGSYLLVDAGDRNDESIEETLQKYEQQGPTTGAPAGEEVAAPKSTGTALPTGNPADSQPNASTQQPPPIAFRNGQKLSHRDHLKYCPVIVFNQDSNDWVELRCSECGTNISVAQKCHLGGAVGFVKHLSRTHKILGLKAEDAMNRCKYRVVPDDEVQRILDAGTAGAQHVPQIGAREADEVPKAFMITCVIPNPGRELNIEDIATTCAKRISSA
ncbi:uncharacterized protein MYCFIDRAFT_199707 [Pseudocercospora fijiensis CIRAD86]|uniref:Uncharacterized protein n=1 Tax=Pseudocercospora fijiensis (strain CIRAD86) TaxID=383855 RepID=M3AN11_PSEFD|nr:uncharacterized protein MYCFIDRAFT_199707 [Pseudocercospora fijiensis CIRAD86]EME78518.1 hypothetical protein MYCFIDRAFT_199707 [Pseudocercospora fijiensis CIRAD86]